MGASPVVLEWTEEAAVEERRVVLSLLSTHFKQTLPPALIDRVNAESDLATLERRVWLGLGATSPDDLLAQIQ